MDRGYIALLDVLGFSTLVGGDTSGEKLRAYLQCLETASHESNVNYVVFSDSIVLTAKGAGDASFLEVARGCSNLFAALLAQGIALRGAITFGEIFRSSVGESVFVAGRAVIDAYQYERQQDWVGVMVAPSAVRHFPDVQVRCGLLDRLASGNYMEGFAEPLDFAAYVQPCHGIPFHAASAFDESSFDGFAIVPSIGPLEPANLRDGIGSAIKQLDWLRSIAPAPSAQRKYAKTMNWLRSVWQSWNGAVFRQQQHAERQAAQAQ